MKSKNCCRCSGPMSDRFASDTSYCKPCRRAVNQVWKDENPYWSAAAYANQRARKLGVRGWLNHADVESVYQRAGFVCECCGVTERLSLDHVVPLSLGGPNTVMNSQILCRPCNSRKGKKVIDYRK